MQAYCFRETLTDDPARRLPPDKPEGYADFLPMYRSLYKDLEIGRIRKLRDIIWIDPIPNRKWCTNGHIEALTSLNISEWNQGLARRESTRAGGTRGAFPPILAGPMVFPSTRSWTATGDPDRGSELRVVPG